jgi:3-deoxy-D-manno-octulosonate 8-phosphate phosphatase KdsC-like HAD superfamily phosphatase
MKRKPTALAAIDWLVLDVDGGRSTVRELCDALLRARARNR